MTKLCAGSDLKFALDLGASSNGSGDSRARSGPDQLRGRDDSRGIHVFNGTAPLSGGTLEFIRPVAMYYLVGVYSMVVVALG